MRNLLAAAALMLPLAASAADLALPPLDESGMTTPLTEAQLTPAEREVYNGLPPTGEDRTRYLYTRGYFRYAQRVVARQLEPLQLPPLPSRRNWNRGFLTPQEARDILDVALGMKMVARMPPANPGPAPV
jgi:hypothetical protein